ncbi:MAG: GNAT family N-acetyltransferase [Paraglaciecola sp.]|uniref:GNAT family N-acetyltransferase n=1 Tax=Paraglaciecola sp. TaxID=1920173 RepID=UPI003296ADA3
MTTNIIRCAKPQEASFLSDLALRSKGYWGYDSEFLSNCKKELTYNESQILSSNYSFKVAESSEQHIVGFFILDFTESKKPQLEALFIEPDFIGLGWGKRLLGAAISLAKQRQAKCISLQSDPFAEDFYLANGAKKVGSKESHSVQGRFLPLLEICL